MQYIIPSFVALAIGANAVPAPHWSYPHGFGGPIATGGAFPSGTAFPTGLVPTGTGFAPAPTASPSYKGKALARDDDDDDDDEEDEEDVTSSKVSSTKSARSTKSAKSTKSSKDASSTEASEEVSSTKTSGEVSSTKAGPSATVTSAPTTTSKASSGSGGSAGGKLPASSGTSILKAVQTIAAGESFDGGMVAYDRGVSCTGQSEGGDSDTVFYLEAGASLSNVIIGPNQIEGVHCFGGCTLTNVWWSAVCEDAFTIKEQEAGETTTISGGGAFGAEDKVLQHNGGGTLSVSDFAVESFGKLYRSCGNCKTMYERHVVFDNISATDGKSLAGINSNYGDTATFTNVEASSVKSVCDEYKGNDSGDEPEKISSGPSSACIYTTSDVSSS